MNSTSGNASWTTGAVSGDEARLSANRLMRRAELYAGNGDHETAIESMVRAHKLDPDNLEICLALADASLQAGQHNTALAAAHAAIRAHISRPALAVQLIQTLNRLSESSLIVRIIEELQPKMWDSPQSLAQVGFELNVFGAHEQARAFAAEGLRREPGHPPCLALMATTEMFFGKLDAAAEYSERCLALLPDDAGSHWLISRMKRPDPGPRIDRIRASLARVNDAEAEVYLAYALHNELHDQGDFPAAWDALTRACNVKRRQLDYSPERARVLFDSLLEWREPGSAATRSASSEGPSPVFVIGLHRSGTTLTERLLSGHSQVSPGGETYQLRAQLRRATGLHFPEELNPQVIALRDRLDYPAIGAGYRNAMAWRCEGAPWVSDKLPSNYYNVGFIARAMPEARFIHVNRDPMDVGLSSLRTLFSQACPYSYDQKDFLAHWRGYRQLMDHWRELYSERILDLDYAEMAADPASAAKRMAEFCGLSFEPGMVEIRKRKDAVSTASAVMMRDGVRKDRGGLWQNYAEYLQPLQQGLADLESTSGATAGASG